MTRSAILVAILLLIWIGLPLLIGLSQGAISIFLPVVANEWELITPTQTIGPGYVLVTEVLYNPFGSEPDYEWIEIYNPGGGAVDLMEYKIGDEEQSGGAEGMYSFPEGYAIEPGQVIVIANRSLAFEAEFGFKPDFEFRESDPLVPNLIEYTSWASGNISLDNNGDEVLLLGGSDELLDAMSWGSSIFAFFPSIPKSPEGHSLERRPAYQDTDSAGDWSSLSTPDPGHVNLLPPGYTSPTPSPTFLLEPTSTSTPTQAPRPTQVDGGLVISEVLYRPSSSDSELEWIEIYNPQLVEIELFGYKLGDEETSGGSEGMYAFPGGSKIGPGEVLVIANTASYFIERYGFAPDFEIVESDPQVQNLIRYDAWSTGVISLGNPTDEVLILNSSDQVVDALSWGTSTWAFDPACPVVSVDHSLDRVPAENDTDTAADWIDQPYPNPGQVYHDR